MYRHDYPHSSSARVPPFCFQSGSEDIGIGLPEGNPEEGDPLARTVQVNTQQEEPTKNGGSTETASQGSIEGEINETQESVIEIELSHDIPLSQMQTGDP